MRKGLTVEIKTRQHIQRRHKDGWKMQLLVCVYLGLRPYVQQVETIDVRGYARFHGVVTKHTHSTTLGELPILIVEILLCVCVCVCMCVYVYVYVYLYVYLLCMCMCIVHMPAHEYS